MSSTQEASSQATSNTKNKDPKNRRSWTRNEEAGLIIALKEVAKDIRYKADNGFKAGYLSRLEELLQLSCPGTDLKGVPHITSKLSSWKKYYSSLTQMLRRSGVGFSPRGNFMIDCEDDQWEQIVKADPHARLMRHKQWPHYEDWKEIFGVDRATGEHAEDIYQAYLDATREVNINSNGAADSPFGASHDNSVEGESTDQVSQSFKDDVPPEKKSRGSKKARLDADFQGVCEMLSEQNQATNARLDHIASRIGYDYDMGKARQETYEQLRELPGLSRKDRWIVAELVTFKVERLDIWRMLDKEERAEYVEHLLETNRQG